MNKEKNGKYSVILQKEIAVDNAEKRTQIMCYLHCFVESNGLSVRLQHKVKPFPVV